MYVLKYASAMSMGRKRVPKKPRYLQREGEEDWGRRRRDENGVRPPESTQTARDAEGATAAHTVPLTTLCT
jgi:hypothetical protein